MKLDVLVRLIQQISANTALIKYVKRMAQFLWPLLIVNIISHISEKSFPGEPSIGIILFYEIKRGLVVLTLMVCNAPALTRQEPKGVLYKRHRRLRHHSRYRVTHKSTGKSHIPLGQRTVWILNDCVLCAWLDGWTFPNTGMSSNNMILQMCPMCWKELDFPGG